MAAFPFKSHELKTVYQPFLSVRLCKAVAKKGGFDDPIAGMEAISQLPAVGQLFKDQAMDVDRLLQLARQLISDLSFCVASTDGEDGSISSRIVQPLPLQDDWTVNTITNRRCRKVREIERSGRMTLLYQHDPSKSYVALMGKAEIVEDAELKRSIWTPSYDRWNKGGPGNPATVFVRLATNRIELWSAVHDVMPPPTGYSAATLMRHDDGWRCSAT